MAVRRWERKVAAQQTQPLVREVDVPDGEARGLDRHRVKRGRMVRQPPKWSEKLQTTVPARRGKVKRIYRRGDDPRVLIETFNGHVLDAAACKRSYAHDEVGEEQRLAEVAQAQREAKK